MKISNISKKISSNILKLFVILMYLFLYLPVIILIIFSFNKSPIAYTWTGFTFDWYKELFQINEVWFSLFNSIIVGLSAVILSVIMGTLFIWSISNRFKYLVSLFYMTMMIPDVVIAAGLLTFFSFFSIPLGYSTIIAGHTLLGLGLVVPIIYSRYSELNYQIVEASLNLGATQWQTFIRVILPFLKPAISSSAVSVFILSFDDFLISFFCAGSHTQTLSLYIFSIIRLGVSPIINALTTLILIFSILMIIAFSILKIKPERQKL